ncbi:hypothetical protein M407DRAFT_24500 [Tulasnella calospora MUT 4182]|uniref:Uncharacterized protein n=1 Tax=Tulasnella calospora MUT 4182 TaxID=1051891 RepID=A0A0C3QHP3_9AGAM|nr:hypothetical protein M407DRAFT_24500 [Tulasnella calospora MUT 4182]
MPCALGGYASLSVCINRGPTVLGIGKHLTNSYIKAVESLDQVLQDLDELEASIGPEASAKLRAAYDAAGGEQFLQDSTQLQWLSRKDLFARMQDMSTSSTTLSTAAAGEKSVAHLNLICKALKLEALQAKLCLRAHDLGKLPNPTPTLRERLKALMNQVAAGLQAHNNLLREVAPQLEHLIRTPVSPGKDEILLPSRLSSEEILHYDLASLLATEMRLRICHAYDLIHELRKVLGMQGFWTRHVNAQHSSQTSTTKGQSNLQASKARVHEVAQAYRICYEWLAKKSLHTAEKFGLRPLLNPDLVLLITDLPGDSVEDDALEGELSESDDMEPDAQATAFNTLEELIEDWRNEFVRLDFVHTLAATERWTEEVRILTREMVATCRSLRNSTLVWSQRADERVSGSAGISEADWFSTGPEVRGYVAYASRQYDLYARLTTDVMQACSDAVGEVAWKDIWLSPHEKDLMPGADLLT